MCKNRGIYGFYCTPWVLITVAPRKILSVWFLSTLDPPAVLGREKSGASIFFFFFLSRILCLVFHTCSESVNGGAPRLRDNARETAGRSQGYSLHRTRTL